MPAPRNYSTQKPKRRRRMGMCVLAAKKTRKLRRIHVPLFLTPNSARQRALKGVERYLQLLG